MRVGWGVRRNRRISLRAVPFFAMLIGFWTAGDSVYSQEQSSNQQQTQSNTQADNGIHVGKPKVYDSRELTLMLDNFSSQLRGTNFVDPKALSTALGNVQGYTNTDESAALFLNGAVGPGAANVFSGGGAASSTPSTTSPSNGSSTPAVTINVAPTLNAGSATSSTASTGGGTPSTSLGPQAPALPTLQTAPTYTPTFGSNGSDLLSDEVNLTYQLYNVRMLLDRSLTDRLYQKGSRLEAVVGFDIDLEPDQSARDAVAIVEVTANMMTCPEELKKDSRCSTEEAPSVVALMPEEGSHNAATLSQKANAFGGAIAASVYSVGIAAQKRSQVFYLYRDMDTLSFQNPPDDAKAIRFGWQFRPVLGRHSIDPGMRHMLVVLGLPSADATGIVSLKLSVRTRWERYYGNNQTTSAKGYVFRSLPGSVDLKPFAVDVPSTEYSQAKLGPQVSSVKWIPTDPTNGVAVVTGENFFPGTTVRIGNKTYKNAADGLILKSDKEIEVDVPLSVAVSGGVLSGRYGEALALQDSLSGINAAGIELQQVKVLPQGDDLDEIEATLLIDPLVNGDQVVQVNFNHLASVLNDPLVLVDGKPIPGSAFFFPVGKPAADGSQTAKFITFVPSKDIAKGVPIAVMFPFDGPRWSVSIPYYQPTLKVTRLGNDKEARLIISATDPTYMLCTDWKVQLEDGKDVPLGRSADPSIGTLTCIDKGNTVLSWNISAKALHSYHRFVLLSKSAMSEVPPKTPLLLVGDIPAPIPPPPGPSLDKGQKVTVGQYDSVPVKFTGKNLDQVTKVLFEKKSLDFTQKDGKEIQISLSRAVTDKPSDVKLQLISDDNDPVLAEVIVAPKLTPVIKGK
jgi:hypothetical protein